MRSEPSSKGAIRDCFHHAWLCSGVSQMTTVSAHNSRIARSRPKAIPSMRSNGRSPVFFIPLRAADAHKPNSSRASRKIATRASMCRARALPASHCCGQNGSIMALPHCAAKKAPAHAASDSTSNAKPRHIPTKQESRATPRHRISNSPKSANMLKIPFTTDTWKRASPMHAPWLQPVPFVCAR